jgi:hypothetical protein
MATYN